jgi:hypothetical protein
MNMTTTPLPLTETEQTEIQTVIEKAEARIDFLSIRYNQQFALQELENIRAQANALLTAYDEIWMLGDLAKRVANYRNLDFSWLTAEAVPRNFDLLHRAYEQAQKVTPTRY